ncbi:MAG: hypothetical protein HY868_10075 [Chloroflexi bacterium]|nr:hypothetical protein [Chloroflexota bacterium]
MNQFAKKAEDDLAATVQIMRTNLALYRQGEKQLYRVVAAQLRLLLCDGKNSLLPRLFGGIHLHPMTGYARNKRLDLIWKEKFGKSFSDDIVFQQPFQVYVGEDGARITQLFNEQLTPIPLEEWLDQPIFKKWMTVRELIRSVADKESVHSDMAYNETLEFTRSSYLNGEVIHQELLACMGEYILRMIDYWKHRSTPGD